MKNDDAKARFKRRGKAAPSAEREPLPELFHRRSRDLGRKAEALRMLVGDKRFARNRKKVAQYRADLVRIRDDIDHILQHLPDDADADAESAA
ncbi:hypothetical protein [Nocardioides sp. TF02-7]|uniref:hypothetical protein n=1 Tax=Nocardioides sp. TF02-7 TaxID=2917724 RepID=UPI001F05DD79|nr:hypothetical protein [Nocardioides sp. TF02-7]UMG92845.1 hypothetical protein MF408_00145 [Nocardioides sp. TF02-7]